MKIQKINGEKSGRFSYSQTFDINSALKLFSSENLFRIVSTDYIIELKDINGNSRQVNASRPFKQFTVKELSEFFQRVFNTLGIDPLFGEFSLEDIEKFFQDGVNFLKDLKEDILQLGEDLQDTLDEGFRYVWEKYIVETLTTLKEKYYDPAEAYVDQTLDAFATNKNIFLNDLTTVFSNNQVNTTLRGIENVISEISDIIEPISSMTSLIQDKFNSFIGNLGMLGDGLMIFIEALQKLGQQAIDLLLNTISNMIGKMIDSLIGSFLSDVSNFIDENLQKINFDNLGDVDTFFIDIFSSPSSFVNDPISILSSFIDIIGSLGDATNSYYSTMNIFSNIFGQYLNLITTSPIGNISLLKISKLINTGIYSIILPVVDLFSLLFGFSTNDFINFENLLETRNNDLILFNDQLNLDSSNYFDNLLTADFTFMITGVISEYLAAGRDLLNSKTQKVKRFIFSLTRTTLSFIGIGGSNYRKEMKNRLDGGEHNTIDGNLLISSSFNWDYKKDYLSNFPTIQTISFLFASAGSAIRDLFLLKFDKTSLIFKSINSATYGFEFLTRIARVVIDFNNLIKNLNTIKLPGYIISIIENGVKMIRALVKAIGEKKMPKLNEFFKSREIELRVLFSATDVFEDIFVVIFPDIIKYNV